MHVLYVTFFDLFVFRLQVDVVGALLLNASLLLVLTTGYSDWLVQVTELIDIDNDGVFWVLSPEIRLIRSFNVDKSTILECLCSLLALLACVILFSCVIIFNDWIF